MATMSSVRSSRTNHSRADLATCAYFRCNEREERKKKRRLAGELARSLVGVGAGRDHLQDDLVGEKLPDAVRGDHDANVVRREFLRGDAHPNGIFVISNGIFQQGLFHRLLGLESRAW